MAVSKRVRYEVFRRDNNRCRYCGATAPETPMTIDHAVPTALGGSDDPSNLVTACRDCNAGKTSSSPDAPLVADVADDAIRWAKAMQQAADERARDRELRDLSRSSFQTKWESWTYKTNGKYRTFEMPPAWGESVDQFLAAGLDMEDLHDLVDVAMGSRSRDPWKYFCGCCWRRINDLQNRAAEILKVEPPMSDSSTEPELHQPAKGVTSRWTWEEISRLWESASERLAAAEGTSVDEVLDAITSCIHNDYENCGDPICDVLAAARMFGKAYVIEQSQGECCDAP